MSTEATQLTPCKYCGSSVVGFLDVPEQNRDMLGTSISDPAE
jgi:hypothetical protein